MAAPGVNNCKSQTGPSKEKGRPKQPDHGASHETRARYQTQAQIHLSRETIAPRKSPTQNQTSRVSPQGSIESYEKTCVTIQISYRPHTGHLKRTIEDRPAADKPTTHGPSTVKPSKKAHKINGSFYDIGTILLILIKKPEGNY